MNRTRLIYGVSRALAARWLSIFFAVLLCGGMAHAQANYGGTEANVTTLLNVNVIGFTVDPQGNIYLCDVTDNQLYESAVAANGYLAPTVILTGGCAPGSSQPPLAVDAAGSLYYNVGAQVLKAPKISGGFGTPVVVASGLTAVSDVKVDAAGNVFIDESAAGKVLKVPFAGNAYGAPVTAVSGLSGVTAIAVGTDGSVYGSGGYGASSGFVIKAVFEGGGYLGPLTIATGINDLTGIAVDASGDVFVSSDDNFESPFSSDISHSPAVTDLWMIPIVRPGTYVYGTPVPIGGGDFYVSMGAANDAAGNIYVLWVGGPRGSFSYNVEKVNPRTPQSFGSVAVGSSTQQQVTFWITGTEMTPPTITATTQGAGGKDFTASGTSCTPDAGTPFDIDGYPLTCTAIVTFAPKFPGERIGGALLISGDTGKAIGSVPLAGTGLAPQVIFSQGMPIPVTASILQNPLGVTVDAAGNVYVADTQNRRVLKLPWNGAGYDGPITLGEGLGFPPAVAVDSFGNVFVPNTSDVIEIPWNGTGYDPQFLITPEGTFANATGIAIDDAGNLYICDQNHGGTGGIFEIPLRSGAYGNPVVLSENELAQPTTIAVDAGHNLYVADYGNGRVAMLPFTQTTATGYGPAQTLFSGFSTPAGVAVDGDRNLYVADFANERVYSALWNGTSYGPVTQVLFVPSEIQGIAVDAAGRLYVANWGGSHVDKYDRTMAGPLTYLAEPVGQTGSDSPQLVMMSNIGNEPLTFSVVYPKDFPADDVSAAFCSGSSLAVGGSCQLQIAFKPTVAGPLSENVVITDNNLNVAGAKQSISVSSMGSVPAPVIAPGSGSYSTTPIVTITDAQAGTAIYYTTNGATPTAGSTLYMGSFPVIFSETVKAVAIANNVSSAVTSATYTVFDSQVQVSFSASTITYPASTLVTVTLQPNAVPGHSPTGTVQLFVDGVAVTTQTLSGTGNGFAKAFYQLAGEGAGQHSVYALYSGDTRTAPGASAVAPLTVLAAPVSLAVSCVNPTIAFGANYTCKVYTTPVAAGTNTVITYKLDNAALVTVPLSGGVANFTIIKPAVGAHTVVISYAAQGGANGNYGAATPKMESFTVNAH
jgi:sugar lactone lactonase YvrE